MQDHLTLNWFLNGCAADAHFFLNILTLRDETRDYGKRGGIATVGPSVLFTTDETVIGDWRALTMFGLVTNDLLAAKRDGWKLYVHICFNEKSLQVFTHQLYGIIIHECNVCGTGTGLIVAIKIGTSQT